MSRIRGGHNYSQIRVVRPAHLRSLQTHPAALGVQRRDHPAPQDDVVPGGAIIYDSEFKTDADELRAHGTQAHRPAASFRWPKTSAATS